MIKWTIGTFAPYKSQKLVECNVIYQLIHCNLNVI